MYHIHFTLVYIFVTDWEINKTTINVQELWIIVKCVIRLNTLL